LMSIKLFEIIIKILQGIGMVLPGRPSKYKFLSRESRERRHTKWL